jgi:hypothetical protein
LTCQRTPNLLTGSNSRNTNTFSRWGLFLPPAMEL